VRWPSKLLLAVAQQKFMWEGAKSIAAGCAAVYSAGAGVLACRSFGPCKRKQRLGAHASMHALVYSLCNALRLAARPLGTARWQFFLDVLLAVDLVRSADARGAPAGTEMSNTGMLVVESVVPGGPAAGVLEPGDVVRARAPRLIRICLSVRLSARCPADRQILMPSSHWLAGRAASMPAVRICLSVCLSDLLTKERPGPRQVVRLGGRVVTHFLRMEELLDDSVGRTVRPLPVLAFADHGAASIARLGGVARLQRGAVCWV
jgi:hypothetical protein